MRCESLRSGSGAADFSCMIALIKVARVGRLANLGVDVGFDFNVFGLELPIEGAPQDVVRIVERYGRSLWRLAFPSFSSTPIRALSRRARSGCLPQVSEALSLPWDLLRDRHAMAVPRRLSSKR